MGEKILVAESQSGVWSPVFLALVLSFSQRHTRQARGISLQRIASSSPLSLYSSRASSVADLTSVGVAGFFIVIRTCCSGRTIIIMLLSRRVIAWLQCNIMIWYNVTSYWISMVLCKIVVSALSGDTTVLREVINIQLHENEKKIEHITFLTHCGLVMPFGDIWRSGSTLVQAMVCCLTAPSYYLNQCWLIISKVQLHSSDGNLTSDTSVISD